MHPARRRLAFLPAAIAAIAAVVALMLPAGPTPAATVSAARNSVGATHPETILTVGVSHPVSPGERRCEPAPQPGFAAGACVAAEDELPALTAARSALEAKFKHAAAFGVTEARGAAAFDAYGKAVSTFVNDSSTVRVLGTYRGNSAILNYNPESSLVVVQSPSGGFVSGWQMSQEQLQNVIERGSLGGG
jgi:Colicin D